MTLWANPNNVPKNEQYIRFSPEYLEGARISEEIVYDSEKVLVSRSTNRNAQNLSQHFLILRIFALLKMFFVLFLTP